MIPAPRDTPAAMHGRSRTLVLDWLDSRRPLAWLEAFMTLFSTENYLAIQVVMMPRDTNPHGTIFGGVVLSYIDQAGAVGGRRAVALAGGPLPFLATVAMNRVEFRQPVLVGDVVRFLTRVIRVGRTSITMHVSVQAERGNQLLEVTEAEVVYVSINLSDPDRRPISLFPTAEPR